MAAHGSGAVQHSREQGLMLLNIDRRRRYDEN